MKVGLTALTDGILRVDCHGRRSSILHPRTGCVLAVLLGQHVPGTVHGSGTPGPGVSVDGGAPVALPPVVDEGEDAVPAGRGVLTAGRRAESTPSQEEK